MIYVSISYHNMSDYLHERLEKNNFIQELKNLKKDIESNIKPTVVEISNIKDVWFWKVS